MNSSIWTHCVDVKKVEQMLKNLLKTVLLRSCVYVAFYFHCVNRVLSVYLNKKISIKLIARESETATRVLAC